MILASQALARDRYCLTNNAPLIDERDATHGRSQWNAAMSTPK
jgi:hypothetical protein